MFREGEVLIVTLSDVQPMSSAWRKGSREQSCVRACDPCSRPKLVLTWNANIVGVGLDVLEWIALWFVGSYPRRTNLSGNHFARKFKGRLDVHTPQE